MKKSRAKKILGSALSVVLILSSTAFAAGHESYAKIYKDQTEADGAVCWFSGWTNFTGRSEFNEENALWVEAYKSHNTVTHWDDPCHRRMFFRRNYAQSMHDPFNALDGSYYYVHLDPDGPNGTGCEGSGKIYY